jgi:malonate-semialdehyde dehydrogenase (acetylating)/methylmalonate-semialdehyde dehydrogenase
VGDGSQAGVDMGPLVTRDHCKRVDGYIDKGIAEGATPLVNGRDFKAGDAGGNFLGPTIFDPYGNATAIFTASGKSAREYSSRCEVGMVGVNVGVAAPLAFFPFAGWKNSFFGDLHAHGKDAVAFYTEQKVIMSRWF